MNSESWSTRIVGPGELCSGFMSILDKTKILSNFTNGNGSNTILVDEDSEFNFTCHNNQNINNAKILFGFENPSDQPGYESPASRVLNSSELQDNSIGSNTKPFLIKCDGVCKINFFMVLLDSGSMCNNSSKRLDCQLKEVKRKILSRKGSPLENPVMANTMSRNLPKISNS